MLKPTYTYHYAQPDEYHFSLDSIEMALAVANEIHQRSDLAQLKMLDLCAGCGVIGFNISFYCPTISRLDFLEVQEIYQPYFASNLEMIKPQGDYRFLNINYNQLLRPEYSSQYDVIVCNPPYFFVGEGFLSPSQFKNRCRFFMDSDFDSLIGAILNSLRPQGTAYLLLRPSHQHGRDQVAYLAQMVGIRAQLTELEPIRGTHLLKIQK